MNAKMNAVSPGNVQETLLQPARGGAAVEIERA